MDFHCGSARRRAIALSLLVVSRPVLAAPREHPEAITSEVSGASLPGARSRELQAARAGEAMQERVEPATIQVVGRRDPEGLLPDQVEPKAISAVSAAFITKQAPTLNAFQLVSLLPGANVSSSDPFGLSATSSLTLRGLGQDQIGVLLEGAPQNDIGYFYAYPSQFADAENLRQIEVAQGAAGIDAPVVAATGGLLSLTLDDPRTEGGVLVDLSVGSYDERRAFARIDTGSIGASGIRAFLSYSRNRADNWRGPGFDKRQHVDAKLLGTWGNGNRASIALSFNDAITSTYPAPTLSEWRAVGRRFNFEARYGSGDTAYWRLYRSPFRNLYAAAPVHLALSDKLTFDSTAYLQFGNGNSPYGTQLAETGNFLGDEELTQPLALPGAVDGVATVLGNYTGRQVRAGDVAKLTLQAGAHRLLAGLWFDHGTDRVTQSYTSIDAEGRPFDLWGDPEKAIRTADGRLLAYENQRTVTVTKGFFMADSLAVTPRLDVEIGFKGVDVLRRGRNYLPGPQSRVRRASFAALPRASVRYRLDDGQQLFANVVTNFRTPNEFALYDSYYGGELVGRGTRALRDERSLSQELGYRYIGSNVSFSLTAFHYRFRDRQVATVVDSGGALVDATVNGDGQSSHGLDAEIDYRPVRGFSLYASGEYLRARLDDDLPVGDDILPTRGRHAVSAPTFQFGVGSTYDDGRLFGSGALKYVGRQYATFLNDESIPGYATLDLSVGVHLAAMLDGKRTDLRLNTVNLTNAHVLSGVQTVALNAHDAVGRSGSVITGAAPTYYIGSGRAVVATISRGF